MSWALYWYPLSVGPSIEAEWHWMMWRAAPAEALPRTWCWRAPTGTSPRSSSPTVRAWHLPSRSHITSAGSYSASNNRFIFQLSIFRVAKVGHFSGSIGDSPPGTFRNVPPGGTFSNAKLACRNGLNDENGSTSKRERV